LIWINAADWEERKRMMILLGAAPLLLLFFMSIEAARSFVSGPTVATGARLTGILLLLSIAAYVTLLLGLALQGINPEPWM
jgi:hypothetical protein